MEHKSSIKDRKKEFDNIFKDKIVPFFRNNGFERHTKTSWRLFKELENRLSVFLIFDYKTFGSGFYDFNIVYFDADLGSVFEDIYLAIAKIKSQRIKGDNAKELNFSVDLWLRYIKSDVIPFIKKHSNHKAILESNQFYFSMSREKECLELLKRKSIE